MGTQSTILYPHPAPKPAPTPPPPQPDFLQVYELPGWGGGGVGALPNNMSDTFVSIIWRNKYFYLDLSMHVYPFLPGDYFIYKKFNKIELILTE